MEEMLWNEHDWDGLVQSIIARRCTPFLGAGACYDVLPLGRELASQLANQFNYPFDDRHDLPKVAQFATTTYGPYLPHYRVAEIFSARLGTDPRPNELHETLAQLPIPIYLTTNYDDVLARALRTAGRKPVSQICQWQPAIPGGGTGDHRPTVESPLVFHLHGALDPPESMVLAEDDYVEFMCAAMERRDIIPPVIEGAFGFSSFLFLGYSLEDLNFRVLFRKLCTYGRNRFRHVAVQYTPPRAREDGASGQSPEPTGRELEHLEAQIRYLTARHRGGNVKVYWGTCEEFAHQLRQRWAVRQAPAAVG
jgi:hypothetical protein